MEFQSFYKSIGDRKFNTWCNYTDRLDTYGCGCQHDCSYCYSKSLLNFRGLWDPVSPSVANLQKISSKIKDIQRNTVVKIGGMTDCFQPMEVNEKVTYNTILLLNHHKIRHLIVTKSDLVADDKYLAIYDKDLVHFQITITTTDRETSVKYEKAPAPCDRIKAVEMLYNLGFDVSVRLSPFVPENVNISDINNIKCNKILVEFLKVNHWIKKWFNIDYSQYSFKYGGYNHLQLEYKQRLLNDVKGFDQVSVGEYVDTHYKYFRDNVNYNKVDYCNLDNSNFYKYPIQTSIF